MRGNIIRSMQTRDTCKLEPIMSPVSPSKGRLVPRAPPQSTAPQEHGRPVPGCPPSPHRAWYIVSPQRPLRSQSM